jgi:hypothetical protein
MILILGDYKKFLFSGNSFSFLLIAINILFSVVAVAQQEDGSLYASAPIKIDTIALKTKEPLPFDQSFILQYDLQPGEIIDTVWIFQVKIEKKSRQIASLVNANAQFLERMWVSGNLLNIKIRYLPPNTPIDILVVKRLTSKELIPFLTVNERLFNAYSSGDFSSMPQIQARFDFLTDSLRSKHYPAFNRSVRRMSFATYDSIFRTQLLIAYDSLHNRLNTGASASFPTQNDYIQAGLAFDLGKIDKAHLLRLYRISSAANYPSVIQGLSKIGMIKTHDNAATATDYEKRTENITASVKMLDTVLYQIDQVQLLQGTSTLAALKAWIVTFQTDLRLNLGIASRLESFIKQTIIGSRSALSRDVWVIANNDFNDLAQKSKYLIVPDIGITTMVIGGRNKVYAFPRPFIGTNIYLRPVNKNLRERQIPDRDLRRIISLQLGLTFGDFDSNEFKNLFGDFSLLVGPSFKLNRSFRLSPGIVLYKNGNKNPIITQKRVGASFYAAFSFDIDIASNAAAARARVFK